MISASISQILDSNLQGLISSVTKRDVIQFEYCGWQLNLFLRGPRNDFDDISSSGSIVKSKILVKSLN